MYSIKEARKELNLSEVYIRRMIQQEKLNTTKVAISAEVWKHMISEEDLLAWRKNSNQRSIREDGRNKFVIYANADELAKIQQLLKANNINSPLERANKTEDTKKRYLMQKAKRAAKKAQKA
jgi:uncharacterized protein (DUF111 family)